MTDENKQKFLHFLIKNNRRSWKLQKVNLDFNVDDGVQELERIRKDNELIY